MDIKDLRTKSDTELKEALAEERAKLHGLCIKAHSRQLKQVNQIAAGRKTIARILTIMRQKQAAAVK